MNPELTEEKNAKKNAGSDAHGNCLECGMRTSTFCLRCREWYCFNWSKKEGDTGRGGPTPLFKVPMGTATVRKRDQDGKRKQVQEEQVAVCWNTCFHQAHKAGFERLLNYRDGEGLDDITTNLEFIE